jgi:hypothetical protein
MKELIKLHDEIKNHPFWNNFDVELFSGVFKMMRDLCGLLYKNNLIVDTNPHATLINCSTHDFNCISSRYRELLIDTKTRGIYTLVLQTYLSNMHRIIEGVIEDNPVQYNITYKNNEYTLHKYVTVLCDNNKTYRMLLVINESEVDKYIKVFETCIKKQEEYLKNHEDTFGWRNKEIKYYKKEIELLKSGNKITQYLKIE